MTLSSRKHTVWRFTVSKYAVAGLITAVLLPWVVVALILSGYLPTADTWRLAPRPTGESQDSLLHHQIETGPWGTLEISRIIIQPPSSYIDCNPDLEPYRHWIFKNTTMGQIRQVLSMVGVDAQDVERLAGFVTAVPGIKGFVLQPPEDIVRRFSPEVRAALYAELSHDPDNKAQAEPFRFCGSSIYEWFEHSEVNAEAVEKLKPLIYRRGKYLLFSDLQLIMPEVKTSLERVRLLRALHRASTLKVRVRSDNHNTDSILDYWSRGNRRNEIEPLLPSITDKSQNMSVVVFLPLFARTRLYSYLGPLPGGSDLRRDCHWTSFNFFNSEPDNRLARQGAMAGVIDREYDVISSPMLLGDIILIMHENQAIHSCVYIADDIVFTKNGSGEGEPFILEKLEDVVELYRQQFGTIRMGYVRRKGIL